MTLRGVEHGAIGIKLETYHSPNGLKTTETWNCENDEDCESHRHLEDLELCDAFAFEYAIGGLGVTSLNGEEFKGRKQFLQRVVEYITLLDDPSFASDGPVDVEVAIRLQGCSRLSHFSLTHVYWS